MNILFYGTKNYDRLSFEKQIDKYPKIKITFRGTELYVNCKINSEMRVFQL